MNLYGYSGKIARIDLTSGKVRTEFLKEDFARQYIGGKGFGAKILYEELKPKTDPYEPSNLLIFADGSGQRPSYCLGPQSYVQCLNPP
jgi:aldehyde:ferredoxin oxidoreductase